MLSILKQWPGAGDGDDTQDTPKEGVPREEQKCGLSELPNYPAWNSSDQSLKWMHGTHSYVEQE